MRHSSSGRTCFRYDGSCYLLSKSLTRATKQGEMFLGMVRKLGRSMPSSEECSAQRRMDTRMVNTSPTTTFQVLNNPLTPTIRITTKWQTYGLFNGPNTVEALILEQRGISEQLSELQGLSKQCIWSITPGGAIPGGLPIECWKSKERMAATQRFMWR